MLSKNQLKKTKKREEQAFNAVKGLKYLLEEIQALTKYPNQMEEKLEILSSFIREYSGKNEPSNFKNLIAFSKYKNHVLTKRAEKIKGEIERNRDENLKWRDFEMEIMELYKEGESNEKIAQKIREKGVRCNRETIRQFVTKKI